MKDFKEEALKKKTIRNFVYKNYSKKIPKKMVKYFFSNSIGPSEKDLVAIINQGEFLMINREGNILGPS